MKNGKRAFIILFVLVSSGIAALLISAAPFEESVLPVFIQGCFYTKTFQCFYMSEAPGEKVANNWQTYSLPINKDNLAYDGMNGSWYDMAMLRIKAGSPASGDAISIYIDNIKILNKAGEVLLSWDFNDGEAHGPYLSQGSGLDGNGTVVDLNGEKCFLLHGKTKSMYGNNGIEIQWNLPKNPQDKKGKWNLSDKKEEYTLSFDYFYAVK